MRRDGFRPGAAAIAAVFLCAIVSPAHADVLTRFAVPGAGYLDATSGNYRLSGALGQSAIGRCASESYALTAGFWCVPGAPGSTAVGPPGLPGGFRLLGVHPNPAAVDAAVVFDLPAAAPVRVLVFDVGGRLVRTLAAGWRGSGRHAVRWDGRDDAGAPAAAGLYVIQVSTGADRAFTKSIRLR
jgi:hypothetical protein